MRRSNATVLTGSLLAALGGLGCDDDASQVRKATHFGNIRGEEKAPTVEERPEPVPPLGSAESADAERPELVAQRIYETRCQTCHGADGTGSGPAADSLPVQPRDYTTAEWQQSVSDASIAKIILEGGAAVGKSPIMPPNPDLRGQTEVVEALVEIVRSFEGR